MRRINPSTIHLTPENVQIYRELYYEHYKPLVKLIDPEGPTKQVFVKEFSKALNKFNWSMAMFETFKSIDLMQRIVYDSKFMGIGQKFTPYPEYAHLDPNNGALRLKCPERTEAPDPIIYN